MTLSPSGAKPRPEADESALAAFAGVSARAAAGESAAVIAEAPDGWRHHVLPEGRFLYARNLATNDFLWAPGTVAVAEAPISTPPVVAGDTVYFASEDGVVHAVDAQTGETLWTWKTGLHVRSAIAVVDGVVFIAGGDGFVYALGG